MARKNKKHEEHGQSERWLVTYADLITLLLVFFIIMYAMSKVDQAKFDVIAKALMFQFKKSDMMMPQGNGVIGKSNPAKGSEGESTQKNNDIQQQLEKQAEQEKKDKDLQELKDKLEKYIQETQLQAQISINNNERGLSITLNDLFLYDLGKADLKPAAFPILEKLAGFLPTLNTMVSIEGHTDNLPLAAGNPYRDNWGLSSERSLNVLRYFTEKSKLSPKMFLSTSHADTQPVASNDSDANRQKNRRVEIIVLR